MSALNLDAIVVVGRLFKRTTLSLASVVAVLYLSLRSSEAQQIINGQQDSELCGWSVSSAGDVNGDGFGDVFVGCPSSDNSLRDSGRVVLYLGSSSGVISTPAWSFSGESANAFLGNTVATAGDVNGDGFGDVLVGSPNSGPNFEGAVYLFLGSASGLSNIPAWVYRGATGLENLGQSVASAGDVNKDGFNDVIIGAPSFSNGDLAEGRALIFLGTAQGLQAQPVWSYEGNSRSILFGWSVSSAADVNGDGYIDVVVGALQSSVTAANQGQVFIFSGSATGISQTPTWSYVGDHASAQLGVSVAGVGDVNQDGFADVLVGEHGYSRIRGNAGRALLFMGSATGLSNLPAWIADGSSHEGQLGYSVAGVGDINKDGYSDFVLGARGQINMGSSGGAAFLYLGSRGGPSTIPDWSYFGRGAVSLLGTSVSSAGDVNGDGRGDLILGAAYTSNVASSSGSAFVFLADPLTLVKVDDYGQCSSASSATPAPTSTPTSTSTPSPTPTVGSTPTFTPAGTNTAVATSTSTPTPTPTQTPTSSASPNAQPDSLLATPTVKVTVPADTLEVCASGSSVASLSASINRRAVSCKSKTVTESKRRKRWALESFASAGSAVTSCNTTGGAELASFDVKGLARATGNMCTWNYKPVLNVKWAKGSAPSISVQGLNDKCQKKLKGGRVRKVVIKNGPGKQATITGQMRAPLPNCSGWHTWEKFEFTVTGQ